MVLSKIVVRFLAAFAAVLCAAPTLAQYASQAPGLPLSGGTINGPLASNPSYVGYWDDIDSTTVQNLRLRERVFIGDAINTANTGRSATCCNSPSLWSGPNSTTPGAAYLSRDAQLSVMSDRGVIGISGGSRASDGADLVPIRAPIGVSGYIINDAAAAQAAWAFYADIQHQPSNTSASSYGLEIAAKNKGTNQTGDAYGTGFGVFGVWLNPGGDPSYGGAAAAPSNAGIVFVNNGNANATWNEGIVFADGSLTKTNGISTAMSLGQGAKIQWNISAGLRGAAIRSDVSIAGRDMQMAFLNNQVIIQGPLGSQSFDIIHQNGITVANWLRATDAAAGGSPVLSGVGSDTDIDVTLTPKGAGLLGLGYAATSASVAANFSAARIIPIKANGVTYYVAASTAAW